jgi:hypothetical protein
VSVGVDRHNLLTQVVFDKIQRLSRRGVISVHLRLFPENCLKKGVLMRPDNIFTDVVDELVFFFDKVDLEFLLTMIFLLRFCGHKIYL